MQILPEWQGCALNTELASQPLQHTHELYFKTNAFRFRRFFVTRREKFLKFQIFLMILCLSCSWFSFAFHVNLYWIMENFPPSYKGNKIV